MAALRTIGTFLEQHPGGCAIAAAILLVLAIVECYYVLALRPPELTGNGIVIGHAKAFDNRSLALRVERLTASLEQAKVINQDAAKNLQALQQRSASDSTRKVSFKATAASGKDSAKDEKTEPKSDAKSDPASTDPSSDAKLGFALAAADVLSDQINLASQIVSLQTLYERSLSDRLIDGESRLQTVLGFQVSINPPAGYEDCVAITEIAVRLKADPADPVRKEPVPVSLVALMPQEKTYNAEAIRSTERSIDGSAVAAFLTAGATGKRSSKQFFLHRDSDTIAFERTAGTVIREISPEIPGAPPDDAQPTDPQFDKATVFGWEFRPVLGRRAVSAGTRQLLAVISIPQADSLLVADKKHNEKPDGAELEIRTRSYWRRYNRANQTSRPLWCWIPWKIDRSATLVSDIQNLFVPSTAAAQLSLAPTIHKIQWINTGNKQATVIVSGSNFFTGTKVVIGGVTHRTEDNNLTLKSDQALEFETSVDSISTAEAVLSGRFGPAIQLLEPRDVYPVTELSIVRAQVNLWPNSRVLRISVDITGRAGKDHTDVTFEFLDSLPNPMLFVGTELVPMPYDYKQMPKDDKSAEDIPAEKLIAHGKRFVRVEAWVSTRMLAKNPSVTFQVPFWGLEYQSSNPLVFSEPTLIRMGEVGNNSIFRVFYPSGMGDNIDFNLEFDRTYRFGDEKLTKISESECRFTAETTLVARFQNIILRAGQAEPYVLAIPPIDKPRPKPSVDVQTVPVQVAVAKRGSVEWSGHALDTISEVSVTLPGATAAVSQPFAVCAEGTKLHVFLTAGITATEGRLLVECSTANGDKLSLPLFVVAP